MFIYLPPRQLQNNNDNNNNNNNTSDSSCDPHPFLVRWRGAKKLQFILQNKFTDLMVILFESSTEIQQTRESIQNPSPLEALKARSEPSRP